MRHIGFSGTREGCTSAQHTALGEVILARKWAGGTIFHHGDCVGADEQAHGIAKLNGYRVVGHPPTKSDFRAYCECDEFRPERPYLTRNLQIVEESDFLIACPKSKRMTGGTWDTIKKAREAGIPGVIILPDGTVNEL